MLWQVLVFKYGTKQWTWLQANLGLFVFLQTDVNDMQPC